MALLKVHLTLQPDVAADEQARAKVLEEIQRVAGIREINRTRFDRYGLLSGVVDDSKLDDIRKLAGVKTVEPDRVRELR